MRIAHALPIAVLAWLVSTPSCKHLVSDQFRCGVGQTVDEGLANTCARTGEVCMCSTNRCALASADSPSGYRYSFGDEENVSIDDAATALVQKDAQSGFCPGAGPERPCGVEDGTTCRAQEACICATHRCAHVDGTCSSRFRYSTNRECVSDDTARPEAMLFAADASGTLCSDSRPLSPPCGISVAGAAPVQCAVGQCVCAKNRLECAFVSASCSSGYAWARDASCVVDVTTQEIEDEQNQVDPAGYCPRYAPKTASDGGSGDGGNDGAASDGGEQ